MRSSLPPAVTKAPAGSIASMLRSFPVGTKPSEVWRSAALALLRLNASECDGLGVVFEDETASDDLRSWVLDLLAGAGTFEAQVVIRRLLALGVARRNNRTFATYVQRLGYLECPDGPTLRFLMSVYAESRSEPHDVRAACAYALGAAAGQAFTSGDQDAAVRASDVLRRDLLAAGNVVEKCALLAALGNAGVLSDVAVITRFSQDAEAPVRASAALGLRKMTVPEATAQLVTLLGDSDVKVAQSALHALADHELDDEELDRLADMVLAGRTSLAIDARVLRLIVAQKPRLRSLPSRGGAIESALRLLLGRVEAAAASELTGSGERRAFGSVGAVVAALPSMSRSGSVPVMQAAAPVQAAQPIETINRPAVARPHNIRTLIGTPQHVPVNPASQTAPQTSPPAHTPHQYAAPQPLNRDPNAATVMDHPPIQLGSGAYSVVNRGDSVETVRERMLRLGLDPNARTSQIPHPPVRRAAGDAHGPCSAQPSSTQPTMIVAPVRAVTAMQPNAIVRPGR